MATWVRCTTSHGDEIRVNLDHVATVRQYQKDGTGCEVTFVGGVPSAIIPKENQEHLTGRLGPSH